MAENHSTAKHIGIHKLTWVWYNHPTKTATIISNGKNKKQVPPARFSLVFLSGSKEQCTSEDMFSAVDKNMDAHLPILKSNYQTARHNAAAHPLSFFFFFSLLTREQSQKI